MVTMVTVWDVCCRLLHVKVHDYDFMLMCRLPYSVHKFSIHVGMNMTCPFQYLPSECQVVHLGSTSKRVCFVCLVVMKNEILGMLS